MIKSFKPWLAGLWVFLVLMVFLQLAAYADSFNFSVSLGAPPPPPPAVRVEVRAVAPSPEHIWIEGHWSLDNDHDGWVWHPGYWQKPPVPWATWHHAEGRDWHGRYYWVKGHWDY